MINEPHRLYEFNETAYDHSQHTSLALLLNIKAGWKWKLWNRENLPEHKRVVTRWQLESHSCLVKMLVVECAKKKTFFWESFETTLQDLTVLILVEFNWQCDSMRIQNHLNLELFSSLGSQISQQKIVKRKIASVTRKSCRLLNLIRAEKSLSTAAPAQGWKILYEIFPTHHWKYRRVILCQSHTYQRSVCKREAIKTKSRNIIGSWWSRNNIVFSNFHIQVLLLLVKRLASLHYNTHQDTLKDNNKNIPKPFRAQSQQTPKKSIEANNSIKDSCSYQAIRDCEKQERDDNFNCKNTPKHQGYDEVDFKSTSVSDCKSKRRIDEQDNNKSTRIEEENMGSNVSTSSGKGLSGRRTQSSSKFKSFITYVFQYHFDVV